MFNVRKRNGKQWLQLAFQCNGSSSGKRRYGCAPTSMAGRSHGAIQDGKLFPISALRSFAAERAATARVRILSFTS